MNPGVADESCPSYADPASADADAGDPAFAGCCRADGTCGVFVTLSPTLALGCVPAEGFVADAGAPVPCARDAAVE